MPDSIFAILPFIAFFCLTITVVGFFLLIELPKEGIFPVKNTLQDLIKRFILNKPLLFYIFLLVGIIVFNKLINNTLIKFLTSQVFSSIEPNNVDNNVFIGIIAYSVYVILYYLYRISSKHIFSWNKLYFWLFIYIVYSYYRFSPQPFVFYPINSPFKYFDIIALQFGFILSWGVINYARKTLPPYKNDFVKKSPLIAEDSPIITGENENDERISGRAEYAKSLAEKLLGIKTEKAFALGITGKWGSGKTFFIDKYLVDGLNEHTQGKIAIVKFTPWKNKGEEAIIKDFFIPWVKSCLFIVKKLPQNYRPI